MNITNQFVLFPIDDGKYYSPAEGRFMNQEDAIATRSHFFSAVVHR
ncbi:MAG: hypothetical protein ABSB78_09835 [Bacteroidota bacterium]